MILAMDSSTAACTAALLTLDGELVAERHEEIGRGHAERLMPMIAELLDHFSLDAPLFAQGSAAGIEIAPESPLSFEDDPADADIIDQIKELLETRVRPARAALPRW